VGVPVEGDSPDGMSRLRFPGEHPESVVAVPGETRLL
jgi:hypothetical protein